MRKITRRKFLNASVLSSTSFLVKSLRREGFQTKSGEKISLQTGCDPWIELNLENMTWNLNQIRKLAKVPLMAVIKANAYGHGLVETAKHLESAGIDFLMVGKLAEALRLREKGLSSPILNYGTFCPEDAEKIIFHNISQSVFDEKISALSQVSLRLGKKAKVQIDIDSGMGRMGISFRDALPYIKNASSLGGILIEGVSTTLTEDDEFDREQLSRFLDLCRQAEKSGISLGLKHAASSDGILDFAASHLDMVRPGITLYGYYPSEKTTRENRLGLKPVLELKCRVVDVKTLEPGDTLSYHRKYAAKKREKIAVIPVGYSDGCPSNVVDKGFVLIRGKRYRLIAAVTANHMIALLGEDSPVGKGDEVVLLGVQGNEKITADDIAGWAQVSNYRILIDLSPLLPRKKDRAAS